MVAHQGREELIRAECVLNCHLQHTSAFWIHGGFPELTGVHLTQTFIALQVMASHRVLCQPTQRSAKAVDLLGFFATLNVGTGLYQAVEHFAQTLERAVFARTEKFVAETILATQAVLRVQNFWQEYVTLRLLVNL